MRRVARMGLRAILALAVGQCLGLRAQQIQGSFTGTVRDQSGALLPGVRVTALEVQTGSSRSSVSSEDGSYTIPLLQNRVRNESPHGVVRLIHVSLQMQSHSDTRNDLMQVRHFTDLKSPLISITSTTLCREPD